MLDRNVTCCFTGHRTIPIAERHAVASRLIAAIRTLYSEGYRQFIAGGAIGFDTLAAKAVLVLRREYPDMRLVLMIPCVDQDKKWTCEQKAEYEEQKKSADEVILLSERYYDGCMQARNRRMVEVSAAVIAYCTRPRSGTGQTVRLAATNDLRVYNVAKEANE